MRSVMESVDAAARANTAEVARLLRAIEEQHKQENAQKLKRDFKHGTAFNMA